MNFSRKLRDGNTRIFNVVEFIGEIFTSAFAGVITFWLCEAAEINPLISAALVGISGHAGSRAIFMLEKWLEHRFIGPLDRAP